MRSASSRCPGPDSSSATPRRPAIATRSASARPRLSALRLRTTRGRWRPAAHLRHARGRGGAERGQQCFRTARVVLRQPSGIDPIELEATRDEALEQTALVQLVITDRVGHHIACPPARAQGRLLPLPRGRGVRNDAKSARSSPAKRLSPQLTYLARPPASRENDAAEAVEFDAATASTDSARGDRRGLNPRRGRRSWRPRTGASGQR